MNMDGVINVYKPAGWTSQDVCAKLRSKLGIKKIGHTGTLDPMATGVLPVCTGKATRVIEYYDADIKTYRASMKLGIETDTLDITGEVTATAPYSDVSEKAVREAFEAYTGLVKQMPPKYSALKVNGKRAYELARKGKDFELSAREVTIYNNSITRLELSEGEIEFEVSCSKGTYIRSICSDIGRSLGCGAAMTALERTASGFFRAEDAIDIRAIAEMSAEETAALMTEPDKTLINLGIALLDDKRVTAFRNGNPSAAWAYTIEKESGLRDCYRVYNSGRFLGIASLSDDSLTPVKVFI